MMMHSPIFHVFDKEPVNLLCLCRDYSNGISSISVKFVKCTPTISVEGLLIQEDESMSLCMPLTESNIVGDISSYITMIVFS